MSYQEELQNKLNAVATQAKTPPKAVDIDTHEAKLLAQIEAEFEFAQYDLEESDILRTLKILSIMQTYEASFAHTQSLKLFYIICKMDAINAQKLLETAPMETTLFKKILNAMAKEKLLFKNRYNELELTLEGKSLATRMGMDIFI